LTLDVAHDLFERGTIALDKACKILRRIGNGFERPINQILLSENWIVDNGDNVSV
jgi:hypothetical protein